MAARRGHGASGFVVRRGVAVACAALLLAGGCGGERLPTRLTAPPQSGAPVATRHAALVGSWWRIVLFTGGDGSTHASETTWRFGADGTATRTVVATNLTLGFFDTVIATADWRTEGTQVVLDFRPPDTGTVRFTWRVRGDTLALDARDFLRVGR